MNILFINSIMIYGGGEVWMVNAMAALLQRGHDISFICRPEAEIIPFAETTGASVFPLPIHGDADPRTVIRTLRIIREKRIEAVLTNTDKELRFAGIAARLAGIRTVVCRRGIDLPLKDKLSYRFTYNVLASSIIANSEATRKSLLASASWLDGGRVKVIHNGIDPEVYRGEAVCNRRADFGIPEDVPLVGFVGRLSPQKGIAYLLEAYASVLAREPRVHLLIAGDGELRSEIETFAREQKITDRLHLVGFQEDVAGIMKTIDVLVLPSLWEGFGIVLIEAMAAGKPCIGTRTSSIPEIVVHEETGLLVPPENAEDLAEAIITILCDASLARRMGARGREVVDRKFTLQQMIRKYEDILAGRESSPE